MEINENEFLYKLTMNDTESYIFEKAVIFEKFNDKNIDFSILSTEKIFDMLPGIISYKNGIILEDSYIFHIYKTESNTYIEYYLSASQKLGNTYRRGNNLRQLLITWRKWLTDNNYQSRQEYLEEQENKT